MFDPAADARRAELARMRLVATGLLVLMAGIFALARLAPPRLAAAPFVAAFAEAAMVGALADWFAVTALFRRPLGLPIPQTAIVPRNKARIGKALGAFIAGSFLTPRLLDARLRRFDFPLRLAHWLADEARARAVAGEAAALLPEIVASSEEIRDFVGGLARRALVATPAAPLAGRSLAFVAAGGRAEAVIDRLLPVIARAVAARQDLVRQKVREKAWRWLPGFIDDMLAARLTAGAVATLEELADPTHPWRSAIRRAIDDLAERLIHDPALIARGEAFKRRLLADPMLASEAARVWDETALALAGGEDGPVVIAPAIERALLAAGRWLADDAAARERLQGFVRVAVRRLIAERRQAIGDFVAQVVADWDERELVGRLELQVGRDLQYIRINGTIVGGLAGLAIYSVARLLA